MIIAILVFVLIIVDKLRKVNFKELFTKIKSINWSQLFKNLVAGCKTLVGKIAAFFKKLIPAKKERRIRKPMNLSADAQEAAADETEAAEAPAEEAAAEEVPAEELPAEETSDAEAQKTEE